ncbi:MAG: hypothetical protein KQH79_11440 [Bacteroidetes bacterium]|nr:hypothetical protein [Bacteroidota bacterium]
MRKTKFLVLIVVMFLNTNLIFSQENDTRMPLFGFGIHMEQFKLNDLQDQYYFPVTKFLISFNINDHFKIEPEIGFNFGVNHNDNTNIAIGLGAFYVFNRNKLNIYTGLRSEYDKMNTEENFNTTRETEKIIIGPTLGCEYFFGNHFSVGGELGAKFIHFNTTLDPGGSSDSNSYLSSDAGLLLRFYF